MTETNHSPAEKKKDYVLPASILIAALLVSVSLVYSAGKKSENSNLGANIGDAAGAASPRNVKPVSSGDRVWGDPSSPITIIEFSDLECPFCKDFHEILKQAVAAYEGKVKWVYRHFPLESRHTKAMQEAQASECAAEQGGNEKFWNYIDEIFRITPSNDGLDLAELPKIAKKIGLDVAKFNSCLANAGSTERIRAQIEDGRNAGLQGTPYSIILLPDGTTYPLNGSLPYAELKSLLDQAVAGLE